jgi:hypothetical protein
MDTFYSCVTFSTDPKVLTLVGISAIGLYSNVVLGYPLSHLARDVSAAIVKLGNMIAEEISKLGTVPVDPVPSPEIIKDKPKVITKEEWQEMDLSLMTYLYRFFKIWIS